MKFIFLSPYLEKKIWGGHRLSSFNLNLNNDQIGEAWVISGYENKSSHILNNKFKGMNLKEFYNNHRDFFGNHLANQYPLLVKILDCNENLSIQVHPNEQYGLLHHVPSKNEAWYVLEAQDESYIVYGHNALNKEQFSKMVKDKKWEKLLINKKVRKGDLINVPSGTIHALTKGLLVLEVQQSIDLTYRLYDYGRKSVGRKLNVKETINSCNIPFVLDNQTSFNNELHTSYFDIHIIENKKIKFYKFSSAKWLQFVVLDGEGKIDWFTKIKKGDCFIMNSKNKNFWLSGNIKIAISYIRN